MVAALATVDVATPVVGSTTKVVPPVAPTGEKVTVAPTQGVVLLIFTPVVFGKAHEVTCLVILSLHP